MSQAPAVKPSRPIMRYHGGKWKISKWIVSHFPQHRTYVEPYGGAASVLMNKARSYSEIYNDLDSEIVNVFRVLQNPRSAKRLRELLGTHSVCTEGIRAIVRVSIEQA